MVKDDFVRGFVVGFVEGYVDSYVEYCMVYGLEFDGQRILESQDNILTNLYKQEVVYNYIYQDDDGASRIVEVVSLCIKTLHEVVRELEQQLKPKQQPKRRIRF